MQFQLLISTSLWNFSVLYHLSLIMELMIFILQICPMLISDRNLIRGIAAWHRTVVKVGPIYSLTHGFDNSSPPSLFFVSVKQTRSTKNHWCVSVWLYCPLVLTLWGEGITFLQLRTADMGPQVPSWEAASLWLRRPHMFWGWEAFVGETP